MAPETVSSSSVSPITTIVAELAIELNITLKNNRLYGEDHPVVASNIRKVLERLARGFSYQSTIPIHFTRKTIIFGENFLSKTSPIYQQLAGSMWHAGILGITIEKGVTSSDINRILTIVNELTLARKRLDDVKDQYKGRMPEHIHFDLISKDLFVLRQKDQVSSVSKDEETGLWEDFIFSLGAGGTASDGESPISRSVMELAKKISSQAPTQKDVVEYDQAVVSYLKGLDRSHREQGILSQTDLGKKIGDFIAHINPELRQQILCATLTTPDLSETMIQEFSRVVDYDYLVDSLKALNAQGRALPVTVYRTLSIVGLLGEEEDEIMGAEDDEINLEETEKENFQALLDTLLTEDNRFSYMSQEYEAKIESLQAYAEELARSQSLGSSETYFERGEIEKHFVGICSEIMDRYPEDIEAASSAGRQVDKAFAIFLDRTMLADCFQCIVAGKRAAAIDPKRELFPYTWEKPEVQDLLLSFLSDSEEDNRTYARMILATIGKRVLDKLVPLLVSSQEIGV